MERELLESALRLINNAKSKFQYTKDIDRFIAEIEECLAQPKPAPAAWMTTSGSCFLSDGNQYSEYWEPLYLEYQPNVESNKILSNILSYVAKREDAPMSAENHLFEAINGLSKNAPDFKPANIEQQEILDDVLEYYKIGFLTNQQGI